MALFTRESHNEEVRAMGHNKGGVKKGHNFGGIRDVLGVLNRCEIDDRTDCWIWKLSCTGGKYPKMSVLVDGKAITTTGIKGAMLASGVVFKPGHVAYHYKCTNHKCVNPAHIRVGTQRDKWEHIKESGWMQGDPLRQALNTRIKRSASKLTPHVEEIRSSSETAEDIAKRLGCCSAAVRHIRAYRTHKPEIKGSSVFGWRP